MMELKKYKLGEIGEVCMCKRILKEETNTVSGIPFYKIGTFGKDADAYISREKYEEYKRLYSYPQKGDVLISAAGTIGRTVIFDGKEAYFQDSNIVWINNDETKVLNSYLYYCYKNIKWYTSNGSTILRLYNDNIKNSEIVVPNLSMQKQIVSILSAIDSKISLNRAINRNLEVLAKQIYDYWFVQFDFPDENGKPYKSSGGKMAMNEVLKREIPEGWEVKKIGELLGKVKNTPRLVTDEYLQEGKYPIIDQTRDVYYAGFTNREDAVSTQFPAVVFGDHSCAVKYVNFPFVRGADGTQVMLPNDTRLSVEYLYFFVQNVKISEGYARHYSFLKESPIILPKQEIADMFKSAVSTWFRMITHNRIEITSLTHKRDELLPLLMNGQITIE